MKPSVATASTELKAVPVNPPVPLPGPGRLDYLDATRAFALVLGVVFHSSLSFLPFFMGWAVMDVSTSPIIGAFIAISHSFRMELFFLLAGFFSCLALRRKGTADFLRSRLVRLGIPFLTGWFVLRPLLVSGWVMGSASLRGDYDFWQGLKAGFASLSTLPGGLFTGTHLWFLYYLALITAVTLLLRSLLRCSGRFGESLANGARSAAAWLTQTRWMIPVLIVPTTSALWFMRGWGMDTPDQSLRPHLPVTLVYGGFFLLGWLFGPEGGLVSRFGRLSWDRWLFALIGMATTLQLGSIGLDPGHPHAVPARLAFSLGYAGMMWALVSLTLGLFQYLLRRPRVWVRYVADSSYWMYLLHLPVIVWLQVALAEVPLHWSLKLGSISGATVLLSLLTYDLFVRSTVIGQILSGTRRPRAFFPTRR